MAVPRRGQMWFAPTERRTLGQRVVLASAALDTLHPCRGVVVRRPGIALGKIVLAACGQHGIRAGCMVGHRLSLVVALPSSEPSIVDVDG